ncbi:hypothetical protein WJX73_005155 [Symbiochloris irregularis]|uniref:Histidine-containing phosphotransfer protein n=1 Tax=Symbiochloris irregularis TaxID=706552 RepID=A0AAW1NRV3_9CHLO
MATQANRSEALLQQLTAEGLLDDQFTQLLQLQDESSPEFIDEVITLFIDDTTSKMQKLEGLLAQPQANFAEVDPVVHQLKGSSASFGAAAITQLTVQLREACQACNLHQCQACFMQIHAAFLHLSESLKQLQSMYAAGE